MAKFPIQYSKALPSGRAPAVRADIGAAELGQAYAGLGASIDKIGGVLFGVYQKIENTNKVIENSKAERHYETARSASFDTLKSPDFDINDDDAIEKLKATTEENMQAFKSKYPTVNAAATTRFNRNFDEWNTRFYGLVTELKADRAVDEQKTLEMHYYETGALEPFSKLQYSLKATGQQGPIERDKKIADFQKVSLLHQTRILLSDNKQETRGQSVKTAIENLNLLDPKKLSIKENEYRDKLLRMAANKNTEQQEADRALINKTLFADKNYEIFALVEASSLDEKEKLSFYKLARTLETAPPEGYKDNPVVTAKIFPLIAEGKLTETQIRGYVGRGLSPETAESIIKGEKFWKDYWFKKAEDFLKRNLGWNSRDAVFMHPEGSVSYDAALRELRTIVLDEKLKGREIIEKARDIGLPYLTDYWKEVLALEETRILKMTKMIRGEKPIVKDARTGELGTLKRSDGGISTEISITVTDKRLNKGKPTNIPLLVKGQISVDDLLDGKNHTRKQEEIAIKRAVERIKAGASLPSFENIDEAVKAAETRSKTKTVTLDEIWGE